MSKGTRTMLAIAVIATTAGCEARPTTRLPKSLNVGQSDGGAQSSDAGTTQADAGQECLALSRPCGLELGACCAGSFCEDGPYTPERGRCVATLADGEYCTAPESCTSGVCADNVCGGAQCVALGAPCAVAGASPCCRGSYCETNFYLPIHDVCVVGHEEGAFCSEDAECAAGRCVEGVCGAPRPVTFARVYEEILVPYGCTGGRCHGGAAGALSLSNAEEAYTNLVRAQASHTDCGSGVRVAPGDLSGSLVWLKVAPDMSVCGSKMPPTMGGLPEPALNLLREWISAGAPR